MWLVATATLANGVLSVTLTLLHRAYPRPMILILPFGLHYWGLSLTLFVGVVLVYLSFNLFAQRRVAFWVSVAAMCVLSFVYLLHGHLRYLAVSPLATLALLLVFRRYFFVRSEPTSILRGVLLMLMSIVVALGYAILGFWLLDKHDFGVSFGLAESFVRAIRQLVLIGNADLVPRTRYARWFLESLSIMGPLSILLAVYSLFRPISYRLRVLPRERAEARTILKQYGHSTYDYFKVWPDKSLFFSANRHAFISYTVVQGVAICLGDPVPAEEMEDAIASFLTLCSQNGLQRVIHRVPAAHVFQAEINNRRETEDNHEELQHLGVDGRGQPAFQNVNQHDAGADPQGQVVIPTEQLVEQLGQRVHGDARGENGHHGERHGIQRADAFIESHFQIFWHRPRLGAVIKRHHEHGEEDHRPRTSMSFRSTSGKSAFRTSSFSVS